MSAVAFTNKTRKTNRTVQFQTEAHCRHVTSRNDMCEETKSKIWFRESEYAALQVENESVTRLMECSVQCGGDGSGRGLEHRVKGDREHLAHAKRLALNVVLGEQDRQRANNKDDSAILAAAYMDVTTKSRRSAYRRALDDELEAKQIRALDGQFLQVVPGAASSINNSIGDGIAASHREISYKRSVTFNPRASERMIERVSDFTDQDIFDRWYSNEEIKLIKATNKATVNVLMSRNLVEDDEYILRGLETTIPQRSKIKKHTKYAALLAVLEEQYRQEREASFDENLLAEAYLPISARCRKAAFQRAKMDEDAVSEYMDDVHKFWGKTSIRSDGVSSTIIGKDKLSGLCDTEGQSIHETHPPSALRKRIDLATPTSTVNVFRARIARQA